MSIHKIVRRRNARPGIASLLLLGCTFLSALPGVAELREPERKQDAKRKQDKASAAATLNEGEYVKKTPFGVTKRGLAKQTDKLAGTRNVEVEENGDLITFRRATPFGKQIWKRKRSELSAFEKRLLEAHHAAEPAADAPATSAKRKKSAAPASGDKKSDR